MEKQVSPTRHRILSVSVHDCEVQTFRSGGSGGQNQNKRDTGVRIIHHPSGARGESREERSQLQNKRTAFYRMVNSDKFKLWLRIATGRAAFLRFMVVPASFLAHRDATRRHRPDCMPF